MPADLTPDALRPPAYRLVRHLGCRALLCLRCERISFAPSNVARHICSYCQVCLDDIPAPSTWRIEEALEPEATQVPEFCLGHAGTVMDQRNRARR